MVALILYGSHSKKTKQNGALYIGLIPCCRLCSVGRPFLNNPCQMIVRVPACVFAPRLFYWHTLSAITTLAEHMNVGGLCGSATCTELFRTRYPTAQICLKPLPQSGFISLVYPFPWQICPAALLRGAVQLNATCSVTVIWSRGLEFPLCPSHERPRRWPLIALCHYTAIHFHRFHVLNEQVFNYAADVFCLCLCFLHKSWAPTRERKFHSLFAIINIIRAAS